MNPPGQDKLVRHSALLMAATQVANGSNLLFQMVMGWTLSEEQYGDLASMLGLVLVLATPMDAVRTAVAHYAARLRAENRAAEIRGLVIRWLGGMTAVSLPILLMSLAWSGPLAVFFNIPGRLPVILTGCILAGSFYLPVFSGALQGVQSFTWMAISQHSWGVVRLLAGALLVLILAPRAEWGLLAQGAGVVVSAALGWVGVGAVLGAARSAPPVRLGGIPRYLGYSLLILGGFAVLMNADILMVKRFFPRAEAGLFARAATIGRSVVFISMPVALAMFPKVASAGEVTAGSRRTLRHSFLLAGLVILVAAGGVCLWPSLPLLILFRDSHPTPDMIRLVRQITAAMSPLGLGYLALHFELAQHRFRQAFVLVACAAVYVAAVILRHQTFQQVVAALAVSAGVAVLLLLA
ncbi:MAG: hypothetical protein KKC51_03575, partial [Verrucomicrobia bacterium]|nr:hypothetical protein [Verrucomicrobiota bacterium]